MSVKPIILFFTLTQTTLIQASFYANTIKNIHNAYRQRNNSANLTYNSTLETLAKQWVSKCQYAHSDYIGYGENLGQTISYSGFFTYRNIYSTIIQITRAWYEYEIAKYNFDDPAQNDIYAVGHLTQVLWNSTKQLGCSYSLCNNNTTIIFTCEYYPPGNFGDYGENVFS